MAQKNKSMKRYLTLGLLAVAIAESAHAPLMGGEFAKVNNTISDKPAMADVPLPRGPEKKAPSTWTTPSIANSNDPSTIKKKLEELEGEKLYDPLLPIHPNPALIQPDPIVSSPIDLIPGTGLAGPGIGETGPDNGLEPVYPAHGIDIVNSGGTNGLDVPSYPTGPTYRAPQPPVDSGTLPPTTSVPEPGVLSALVFGLGLLIRPARN